MSRTTVPATMALAGSILLFLWASPALASPGDLDPTFGASGKVTTPIGRGADVAYGVAIQADDKVVAAGTAHLKATRRDFALARYDASGTLDPTFGQGGIVTTDFAGGDDIGYALAIQADGKIVLAGSAFLGGGSEFALARYNPDGTLDTSFGGDGRVTTSPSKFYAAAYALAIQRDGRIVVAGAAADPNTATDFAIVRYTATGTLDTTFGGTGIVLDSHDQAALARAVAIQPDGSILTAGSSFVPTGRFTIMRHTSSGTLDPAFGGDGIVDISFRPGSSDQAWSMALQRDGKIVVAGFAQDGGHDPSDFAVARLLSSGALDNAFGSDGKVTTPIGNGASGTAVAIQADGKIVVVGSAAVRGTFEDMALSRYLPGGGLDRHFGSNGIVTTDFTVSLDTANAVAIQRSDGKIVVAGNAQISGLSSPYEFALARYQA